MADPRFRGSGVALVTPFRDGEVATGVLKELVAFHLREGTDALVVNGSTGEAVTMNPGEQMEAAAAVVEAADGAVPVIVGVGGSATAAVKALARNAAEVGADAILLAPPPYNKPSQAGIEAHCVEVIEAGGLPAVLYNVPGRTACNVLPETVRRVADRADVIGVKEASGDLSQIGELARLVVDEVALYSGNDDQILPVLSLGGTGVISVLANVVPADVSRMVHAFLDGEMAEARRLQLRYLPLIRMLFADPNPVPVRAAVRHLGFEVGDPRMPLLPLGEESQQRLEGEMRRLGIEAGHAA